MGINLGTAKNVFILHRKGDERAPVDEEIFDDELFIGVEEDEWIAVPF